LSASDQCSVTVNGSSPVGGNNNASGVDLTGQWLSLTRSFNWWSRTYYFRGKIRVKNLGSQAASSSMLYIYQSPDSAFQNTDLLLGKIAVSSIPAGGYIDVSVNVKAPYSRGGVYLIGIVDGPNTIVETDETNNTVVSGLIW
jgi:hypothetical protein